ncbi:hypothetical protein ABIA38_008575 [Embleya sp. AB8]
MIEVLDVIEAVEAVEVFDLPDGSNIRTDDLSSRWRKTP